MKRLVGIILNIIIGHFQIARKIASSSQNINCKLCGWAGGLKNLIFVFQRSNKCAETRVEIVEYHLRLINRLGVGGGGVIDLNKSVYKIAQ